MGHAVVIAAALLFSGCGDDGNSQNFPPVANNQNNSNNVNNSNNSNNVNNSYNSNNVVDMGMDMESGDMAGDMAGDAQMMPDADPDMAAEVCPDTPCETGEICVDGDCLDANACESAFDLGTLPLGTEVTRSGSFVTEGTDQLQLSCSGAMATRERVHQFTLTQDAFVDIDVNWMGQFDGALEVRSDCIDVASAETCSDNELVEDLLLTAGTYYLVLEVRFGNPGDFEFGIRADLANCTPGERTCNGNALEICTAGQNIESYNCAQGCTAGVCNGDSCSSPITVGAGMTYAGQGGGYTSELNYSTSMCSMSMMMGTSTPGYDLVFSLPGLAAEDRIKVDAATNDANVNAIFILDSCSDVGSCLATFTSIEDIDYVVQAPGDYWVVVDKTLQSSSDFNYQVTVE